MINHVWSILCQGSSLDSDSNNLSLFNILETITIYSQSKEEHILPLRFEIVSMWCRDQEGSKGTGKARIYYCLPDHSCSKAAEIELNLSETVFYRTIIKSQSIKVTEPGLYSFYVEMMNEGQSEWQRVATLPLLVKYTPEEHQE